MRHEKETPENRETLGRPCLVVEREGRDQQARPAIDRQDDEQIVAAPELDGEPEVVWCCVGDHDAHPDACMRGPGGDYACLACLNADPWTHLAGI